MTLDTILENGYSPLDDEPFMNERQQEFFRQKLTDWKANILEGNRDT
ncbi:MAG: DnaK suppressor protein, partial [Planctomycetota bacterium]